jgi:rubrerythrin
LERSITDRAIKAMLDGLVAEEQSHLLILEIQSKAWEQSQTFVPLKELPTELLG